MSMTKMEALGQAIRDDRFREELLRNPQVAAGVLFTAHEVELLDGGMSALRRALEDPNQHKAAVNLIQSHGFDSPQSERRQSTVDSVDSVDSRQIPEGPVRPVDC